MTGKMKYRLTPFHVVALWFLYEVVIEFMINIRLGDKAELGALFPYIYLGLFFGTLLLDLIVQFINTSLLKWDWKMLCLIQILIIVIIATQTSWFR